MFRIFHNGHPIFLYIFFLLFLNFSAAKVLDQKKVAIVIVDMQSEFLQNQDPADSEEKVRKLSRKQKKLIKWAIQHNFPVLVFQTENAGNTLTEITNLLKGHRHALIWKKNSGGFEENSFSEKQALTKLKQWGTKTIIITGIFACCCVANTAGGAIRNDFKVLSTKDLVADSTDTSIMYPADLPDTLVGHKNFRFFNTLDKLLDKALP